MIKYFLFFNVGLDFFIINFEVNQIELSEYLRIWAVLVEDLADLKIGFVTTPLKNLRMVSPTIEGMKKFLTTLFNGWPEILLEMNLFVTDDRRDFRKSTYLLNGKSSFSLQVNLSELIKFFSPWNHAFSDDFRRK